jgi:hypothetical protein
MHGYLCFSSVEFPHDGVSYFAALGNLALPSVWTLFVTAMLFLAVFADVPEAGAYNLRIFVVLFPRGPALVDVSLEAKN